jgi:nucleoside-diphosphate-sugar epimerase
MVVGNGLIAQVFSEFSNDKDLIVFASGVSNSRELNPHAFEKELALLKNYANSSAILVYFSTCSIYDPELQASLYVQHKLSIEAFISASFSRYWIFRLPNVVSRSANPHTMCNFFYNSILNKKAFVLQENAYRYFVDIEDVRSALGKVMAQKRLINGAYNFLFPHPMRVKELVNRLEIQTGISASYETVKKGTNYSVQISDELKPYCSFLNESPDKYFSRMINRYYPVRSIV